MPSSSPVLQPVLQREHLYFCFDVLEAKLSEKDLSAKLSLPDAEEEYPLFVTWNIYSNATASSSSARLRGCIGTFEAIPLRQGLEEYAIIAALKDRRFSPITQNDLPRLECAISLLTQFEECNDYLDWEVGKHGIYIHLTPPVGSRNLTATYLPEVAREQGWTKEETIDSAIQKAGWNGKVTEQMRKGLRVRRYQSEKASARYTEWQEARRS